MNSTANLAFYCPVTFELFSDPVTSPCGHTFNRDVLVAMHSVLQWKCPTCRTAWQSSFTPSSPTNYALKGAIEAAIASGNLSVAGSSMAAASGGGASSSNSSSSAVAVAAAEPPPIDIQVSRLTETDTYQVTLSAPDVPDATLPLLLIEVADISGSMGNPSANNSSDAAGFSRADLLRHKVHTQSLLLRDQDEMAVVLFDDGSSTAFPPRKMNAAGKFALKAILPSIRPCGGTNIWGGLKHALDIAKAAGPGKNIVIILTTDGESDPSLNPPRGITDTFRGFLDSNPDLQVTLHTVGIGFGAGLDTPLLRSLATIGKGTYNYVPDASMVGTVGIHMLANLMSTLYRNVEITIPETGQRLSCGFLQGGQSRDFLVPVSAADFHVQVTASNTSAVFRKQVNASATPVVALGFPSAVVRFQEGIQEAIAAMEAGAASFSLAPLCAELAAISPENAAIRALLTDISDPDKYKGQIGKAFANRTEYVRWGRHYVPAVVGGHANQWATNFKDESSKLYGGATTRAMVLRGDAIFNDLPPPTASIAAAQYASATAQYATVRAASIASGAAPPPPPMVPSAMRMPSLAAVNSSAGPCFLGDGQVLMADGTTKRVDELYAGDLVHGGHQVQCVIKTLVTHAMIVRLGDGIGCGFTEWHPVQIEGKWFHPNSLKTPVKTSTDAIYNFVLKSGHTLTINGVITCTQGHEFEGPVIGHSYFGKRQAGVRHIIDDLMKSPGWDTGYVIWKNVRVFYDPDTNMISGMDADYA
jgi:hypothetical protein